MIYAQLWHKEELMSEWDGEIERDTCFRTAWSTLGLDNMVRRNKLAIECIFFKFDFEYSIWQSSRQNSSLSLANWRVHCESSSYCVRPPTDHTLAIHYHRHHHRYLLGIHCVINKKLTFKLKLFLSLDILDADIAHSFNSCHIIRRP